ncbi:MAG: nicotinate dehydrogenase subunit [Alphaproteobacteria bacterium]|jgi:CO/xanthine dehydrogenase Mo-binding subunit|nr:nicotinate dehydrogenase subunit [Alphaproteobacteria bacterium]
MTDHDSNALSRRAFLSTTGALVVTLAAPAEWAEAAPTHGSPKRPPLTGDQLSSYITIESDGTVHAYYGKIDGGQGLGTAIAQMVAEEIDVAFERVRVIMGDSALTLDMGGASAAIGVSHGGTMLRRTAAEARRLLVEMAGQTLGLPADKLTVTDGVVHAAADPKKRVSYAELIGGRHFDAKVKWNGKLSNALVVETDVPLKTPAEFKVIGQSFPRRDLPGKVFGTLEMVNDVRLPNMLHARMIRPAVAGAVPVQVDEESIKHVPGAKAVWIKDLLAVVADKEWNAVKAARALKVTWSQSKPNFPGHDKLHDHIRQAPIVKREFQRQNGNFEEGIKQAVRIIEGEYEFPTQSHASTGPACAVADVRDGQATIWTSTQKPYDSAQCVAELLGLPKENVRAIWMFGTGSYGRNEQGDATGDAAVLSKHLRRPVRVQYMRHEALAWDPKGTASVNRSRAGLDASGKVIAYENISKAFSRLDNNTRETRAADVLAGQLLGLPLNAGQSFEIPVASYTFDHGRLGWEIIPPLMERASPLRSTHLRDPYGPPILFGSESFIDEMAAATSTDPVDFRMKYLTHPRDRDAVAIAAQAFKWKKRPSPDNEQQGLDVAIGRGIAFRRHFTTFIALIAEVRVHRQTGKLDLLRYVCAHDVGMIVNPETLKHVIDRQLVYGTSRALFEEVRFDENMVTSVDWLSYPVLHIDSVPEKIEILLIERPEEAPSGAAEMALGLVPAAIGNAVFDATGVRLRRVPFTPERVKAALDHA